MLFTRVVLVTAILFAVAAALAFTLLNSPFAGKQQLPDAVLCAIAASAPYFLLLFATTRHLSKKLQTVTVVASVTAALLGLLAYYGAFRPHDGEFGFVFIVAPVVQSLFSVPIAVAAAWTQRRKGANTDLHLHR